MKILKLIYSILFLSVIIVPAGFCENVKLAEFGGQFYPADKVELKKMVEEFLQKANPRITGKKPFALISPHAGYGYSGQTAAFGYKLIASRHPRENGDLDSRFRGNDKVYNTVIILGTGHRYGFNGISVYADGVFSTPLGKLEVDNLFTEQLLGKDKEIYFEPEAFKGEHSVEAQLPFLQMVLGEVKIVPVVAGDCSLETCRNFSRLLKSAIGGRRDILVVVSSDLYHGYDFQEADIIDNKTLEVLKKMDAESLYYGLREGKSQMCGGFGAVICLMLAKDLGYNNLDVLEHTNSAIVTGNKQKGLWTVGYASCAISTDRHPREGGDPVSTISEIPVSTGMTNMRGNVINYIDKTEEKGMLNKEQRAKLLKIARNSIEGYLKNSKKIEVNETDALLNLKMGAFVTLRKFDQLRGCIGNLVGDKPIYLTVRDMAIEAAVGDPRFPQLKLDELKDVEIEISALSVMEKIDSAQNIELGKHGVLVRKGFNSGVFLPQVATETGWSKEEFLDHLCADKAGLEPKAWKDKNTELYIFTAEVFSAPSN